MKRFLFVLLIFLMFAVRAEGPSHDFELYTFDTSLYSTEKVRNEEGTKVLVVDFFALYCEPCKKALPNWEKFYQKNKDKGFRFVVVALPGEGDRVAEQKKLTEFFKKNGYSFPVVFDKYMLIGKKYGVVDKNRSATVPMAFVLDKKGKIVAKETDHKKLLKKIEGKL